MFSYIVGCFARSRGARPRSVTLPGPGGRACPAAVAAVVTAGSVAMPEARADGAWFTDVAQQAGLTHSQVGDLPPMASPIAEMGGGAAVGDYNGNGLLDLYFPREHGPDILYANQGDGTFLDVTEQAFGAQVPTNSTNGALFADLNNNGRLELFVNAGTSDRHYVFVNDGAGAFEDRSTEHGLGYHHVEHEMMGHGAAAGDYTGNGYLDLYLPDWSGRSSEQPPRNRLLRNSGPAAPGHFQDVTEQAGLDTPNNQFGFAGRFADLNRNGHVDLVTTNDFGHSQLYWNQGDGTFVEGTADAGYGTGTNDMGLAVADYNNNGWLDVFTTSIGTEGIEVNPTRAGNRLYENQMRHEVPGLYFSDRTDTAGVRWGHWGWGASFIDYNNNGLRDLVMVNGWPFDEYPYNNTPMRFWENQGDGTFIEKSVELGLTDDGDGRGVVVADFNNNGWLDILVIRHNDTPLLYENQGGDNDWLRIDTVGTLSNRQGIGAWITVVPDLDAEELFYVHEMNLGNNYAGHNETTAHFGLGELDGTVDYVHIRWPSGMEQELFDVSPNQVLTVTEIPEPGSAAIIGTATLLLMMRRRRNGGSR